MYKRQPYANKVGVRNIGDIGKNSFAEYAVFYRKVETKGKWDSAADGLSVSTINSDISTLLELMIWLVRKKLFGCQLVPSGRKT